MSRNGIGSKRKEKRLEKTKSSVCSKVFTYKYAGDGCEICGYSLLSQKLAISKVRYCRNHDFIQHCLQSASTTIKNQCLQANPNDRI